MKHFLKIFDKLIPKPVTFSVEGEWWSKYGPVGPGSKAGRVWDTWIGKEGFFGAAGDWLGLWDSGTTARHKQTQINTIAEQKKKWEERSGAFTERAMDEFSGNMRTDSRKVGGLIQNLQGGNLATDNSRGLAVNQLIADSISSRNTQFEKTMGDIKDREDVLSDKVFEATRAQETIRDA